MFDPAVLSVQDTISHLNVSIDSLDAPSSSLLLTTALESVRQIQRLNPYSLNWSHESEEWRSLQSLSEQIECAPQASVARKLAPRTLEAASTFLSMLSVDHKLLANNSNRPNRIAVTPNANTFLNRFSERLSDFGFSLTYSPLAYYKQDAHGLYMPERSTIDLNLGVADSIVEFCSTVSHEFSHLLIEKRLLGGKRIGENGVLTFEAEAHFSQPSHLLAPLAAVSDIRDGQFNCDETTTAFTELLFCYCCLELQNETHFSKSELISFCSHILSSLPDALATKLDLFEKAQEAYLRGGECIFYRDSIDIAQGELTFDYYGVTVALELPLEKQTPAGRMSKKDLFLRALHQAISYTQREISAVRSMEKDFVASHGSFNKADRMSRQFQVIHAKFQDICYQLTKSIAF